MKKRITFLMAAFTLLAFLAIPKGMRGQNDYSSDYTGNITLSTEGGANASTCVISISNTNYNGIKAGTSSKAGAVMISVPSGTKYLHIHAAAWNGTTCSLTVTPEGYSDAIALTANSGIANNSPFTFNGNANTSDYYKVITFTSALTSDTNLTFTATGGKRFVIWGVTSEEEGSSATCATPTFSPAAGTYTEAQSVSINCSTEDATIYYTTNGDNPTTNSTVYTAAINVSSDMTIKAMATAEGYDNSAIATAAYAFITLEHAGTLEDPYTVADARAAIDANAGTQGVYATGIVSAIPTAWSTEYNNITFNFVDNEGDNVFLQAYRCASGTGVDASQVAVGDVVVVLGNLTKHNSTYEFGQGCQLVSLTHPAITTPVVTVTPNTINAPAEGADGTLALTYENIEEFISFDYYFCDADGNELEDTDPDYPGDWIYAEINDENDAYTLSYIIDANDGAARTAYMKVYTFDDNAEEVYDIVTVNQAEYVAPPADFAELPFEFNGGKADIEGTDGLTAEGLGSDYNSAPKLKFDGAGDWLLLQFDERPGTLTFDIKGNGSGSDPWAGVFKVMVSTNGVNFVDKVVYETGDLTSTKTTMTINDLASDVRFIKWVYDTKTLGNVALGNIALDEYVAPQEYTLTVEPFENLELITFVNDEMVMEGDGEIQVTNGNQIMLSIVALEGYAMETLMVNGVNHVNDIADDFTYTFEMPAENVTISATAVEDVPPTPGTWVLTDLADLTENDVFVIVGDNGDTYAMPNDNGTSNPPAAVAVTVVEGTLSGEPAANLQWNISITEDGYTFYPNGETETWLYCTNTNNGVRVGTGEAKHFTLDEGYLTTTETTDQRYIGIYNSQDWRCYKLGTEGTFPANIADQTFAFYKKVETLPANSIVIEGYGESEGGYYLIASPFTVSPEDVQGMTEGEYDLYSFDEAEENEWRNYKAGAFTNLEPGKGYLYAHSTTVTLTFDGEAYNGDPIVLKKTAGGDFPGWNLVGNPYTETAYIDRDFYVMNPETGGEIITGEGNEIAPMQGFFVIADQDGEELEISTEPTEEGSKIVMNVNSNRGNIIDRAVVRFGEGRQLPKFMLNEDNTKLYIAKGEEEYAVARNEAKGEMNLNFEAAEDGTYTLDFTVVNVELDQFLLIDNKTGVSIDLLSSSSYTFEANTTDNASRFRVVFGITTTVSEENANTFAFYNNGNLILNNEGSAILNVVDVLGRIISSYNINGSESIHINAQAGVYMLQLVQGDKIQTQKIVVE